MKRTPLKTSYRYFNLSLADPRQSWSARNEAELVIAISAWQDRVKCVGGKQTYEIDIAEAQHESFGARERHENLKWALKHCAGLVRIVIAIAKDQRAKRREVADSFPQKKLVMRITHFDEVTRMFRLEAV